ncbi:RSN1 [Symbiodinium natans]|uniref:RSN1 protein n=1 Tax=Symbiodinium natans TaxID=878477 RepID=A0A812HDN1_9DINO|nr:RSN1 [Symbiodinium natans]
MSCKMTARLLGQPPAFYTVLHPAVCCAHCPSNCLESTPVCDRDPNMNPCQARKFRAHVTQVLHDRLMSTALADRELYGPRMVLINIFAMLFNFKSEVWNQRELQAWYFWFLVFFVIMVTVVGQDFVSFVSDVAKDPMSFPLLLADKMPSSTHYYLNFLGLQWVSHAMNLTRYIQVSKFVAFTKVWNDDDARKLSEPEDQDYYGMGSRSARFSTNLLIAIIFGTISPLMNLMAYVLGSLFLFLAAGLDLCPWFVNGRKQDSGGHFFVNQLNHVFIGGLEGRILYQGKTISRNLLAAAEAFSQQLTPDAQTRQETVEPILGLFSIALDSSSKSPSAVWRTSQGRLAGS